MSNAGPTSRELLRAARWRPLTRPEIDGLMQTLRDTDDEEEREDTIQALGRAGVRDAADMVAGFLDARHDIMVREMAMRCLTEWLDRADLALDTIKHLLAERPDDALLGGTRLTALQIAGLAYRQTLDTELVDLLLDAARSSVGPPRDAALESLLVVITPTWDYLTPGEREELRERSDARTILASASALRVR
jgi:hypothetical protein